jgi:hypothetical protein
VWNAYLQAKGETAGFNFVNTPPQEAKEEPRNGEASHYGARV